MRTEFNKANWHLKLLALIVLSGTVWLGFYFYSEFKKVAEIKPITVQDISNIDTSDWKTYRNEEYGFEIIYPLDWEVVIGGNTFMPVINIVPKLYNINDVFINHNGPEINLSIYPKGVPTEGINSEWKLSDMILQEDTPRVIDYVDRNNDAWGTIASFNNPPISWETFGFIFARAQTKDRIMVDAGARKIERMMLESFKFIK